MMHAPRVISRALTPILWLATAAGACAPAVPRVAARPEGVPAGRITELSGRPFGVRVSPAGVVLVTQQDSNSVARFGVADHAPEVMIPVGRDPGDVVFNRDGSRAYVSAFQGGGLHVIDVARNSQVASVRIARNAYRLAMMPDDSRLFVTSTNGKVYAVDPAEPRVVDSLTLGGALQGIALSPSGRALLVTSTQGGIWKVDPVTLRVLRSNVIPGGLQDVAVTADEREVYVANERFGVDILDGATLGRKDRIGLTGFTPFGLALTRDESELYLTSPATGAAMIVQIRSRTVVYTLNLQGVPRRIAFDAAGRTAFVANESDWVDVIR